MLTPTGITFHFDDNVAQDERDIIQNGVALAQRSFGEAGPVVVFAYANLDALVAEDARASRVSVESASSKDFRKRFENHIWQAAASPGVIWVWVSAEWKITPRATKTRALIHEYFHLVQTLRSARVSGSKGPMWLIEGAADFESYRVMSDLGQANLAQVHSDRIIQTRGLLNPLSSMVLLKSAEVEDTSAPYALGYLAVELLVAEHGGEPALLQFWDNQRNGVAWDTAFSSAFGISSEIFYGKFEEYRRAQFPPYCGTVQTSQSDATPTPTVLAIRFDRQHPPGGLSLSGSSWTAAPNVPYTFCVTGSALVLLTSDQMYAAFKRPAGSAGIASCGGNCVILYMRPTTYSTTSTLAIELPDGRRAEASFMHLSNPATATPGP